MHKLSVFSLRNRAFIALLTIVVAVFGGVALSLLKLELFPSLSLPQVSITTSYPGASPAVVENDVSTPIESAVQGIDGLSATSATSSSGVSFVSAEFDYGTDLVTAEQEVQLAINRIESQLPSDVTPTVSTFSLDDFPVIQLGVTSDLDSDTLSSRLETIVVPELESLDGVREAAVSGATGSRVEIEFAPKKLEKYNITTQAIVDSLGANGALLAVGEITQDGSTLTVQAGERLGGPADIRQLPVLGGYTTDTVIGPDLQPTVVQEPERLTISDVASVRLVANPTDSISRVDGENALTLAITKRPDGNTVEVSHAVADVLDDLATQVGSNTEFTVVFDQAPSVEKSIDSLVEEGTFGLIAAIIVIFVFLLSIRSTLVTAISIPTSLLVTFIGVWVAGFSLNTLTLAAVTISIGRVVDDSIVVIENIKRHLSLGESKLDAIRTAVREVATAVSASTITSVAVFLPLAFVDDITGELFRPFALTATIALLASLFVSLTIVPVLAYWFLTAPKRATTEEEPPAETPPTAGAAEVDEKPGRMQRVYRPIIRWTVAHPVVVLLISVLVLGGTLAAGTQMPTNFVGSSGANTLTVTQTGDAGADLETKDAAAKTVEEALLDVPGVETVQLSIGSSNSLSAVIGGSADATFSITTDEDGNQDQIAADVRDALDGLDDVGEVSVSADSGFASSDILVDVTAPDEEVLAEATQAVVDSVSDLDVVAQATSNLAASQPYIEVDVKRAAAAKEGLSEATVGALVAQAMQPAASAEYESDGSTISIYLVDPKEPQTLKQLRRYELTTPAGNEVRLSKIANVSVVNGPTSISTERGIRTAQVTITPSTDDVSTSGAAVTAALADVELPEGASAEVGGVVSDQDDAFTQLLLALLVSILIVYTVMVATFRSLRQPLLLLVSIPFAATGAVALQFASGVPFGAASFIGVIMLVGIVVTNAIVLIDLVNQYRERGLSVPRAIEEGASRRLRPIIMTALATIVALTPMALGITGQGGFISQPLGIVVIGGLISSTVLTLVVLPTLYALVEGRRERWLAREPKRAEKRRAAAEKRIARAGDDVRRDRAERRNARVEERAQERVQSALDAGVVDTRRGA